MLVQSLEVAEIALALGVDRVFREEASGVGHVAFRPVQPMHFREIFREVDVRAESFRDWTQVHYRSTRHFLPDFLDDRMREETGAYEQMVMRITCLGHLGHAQILDLAKSRAEIANQLRNKGTRSVESIARCVVEAIIDGQRQESIRLGTRGHPRKFSDFRGRAESAGPGFAAEADEDRRVAADHACEERCRLRADLLKLKVCLADKEGSRIN